MSTLKLDTLSNKAGTASVPSDTIVSGTAKAWVNFDGTGTVAIRRAFNVSSITDNATGDYTVNFTNAMPDENFAVVFGGQEVGSTNHPCIMSINQAVVPTMENVRIRTDNHTSASVDSPIVTVAVFS